jgi:hypothetical protein
MIMLIDLSSAWLTRFGPDLEFRGISARGPKRKTRWT